ncbi:MAG TPA: hypothetical protein QF700_01435 [Prochlorococcus sp.]|nr:hypothetical protein [Prochlorococcus sp.]
MIASIVGWHHVWLFFYFLVVFPVSSNLGEGSDGSDGQRAWQKANAKQLFQQWC